MDLSHNNGGGSGIDDDFVAALMRMECFADMPEQSVHDSLKEILKEYAEELSDGLKSSIDRLTNEVGNMRIDVAVQKQQIERIEQGFEKATVERTNIAKEVGAQNIAITGFTGRLSGVEHALAELKPQVSGLTRDRVLVEGGVKAAGMAFTGGSKLIALIWGLAAMVLAIGTFVTGVWVQRMSADYERAHDQQQLQQMQQQQQQQPQPPRR